MTWYSSTLSCYRSMAEFGFNAMVFANTHPRQPWSVRWPTPYLGGCANLPPQANWTVNSVPPPLLGKTSPASSW